MDTQNLCNFLTNIKKYVTACNFLTNIKRCVTAKRHCTGNLLDDTFN